MPGALPPATLEGWYALHQVFTVDWPALRALSPDARDGLAAEAARLVEHDAGADGGADGGWSASFRLVGGGADLLVVHFRESLDALGNVEAALRRSTPFEYLHLEYDYLSVTEAGLYHATAEAAAANAPGSEGFKRQLDAQREHEGGTAHIRTRLYPRIPDGMRYVSFYPMSKRRAGEDNWYTLPIEERNRLMREHGLTGRGFAGRVFQVITGSVGLDDWEWGVTLFAKDPLEFKRIVTDMRYDEASARYGEFGSFYTGIRLGADLWPAFLAGR
jgi:hydrogen peroxide-dependent heme synthase